MLLGPLVKTIRKGNCGIIIIGHDGRDVHPAVRTLAKVVRRYVGNQKRATFYQSIHNRNPVDQITDVRGVPATDWDYDDKEDTSFVWDNLDGQTDVEQAVEEQARVMADDLLTDEKRRIAAQMYLDDSLSLSQEDIGQAFGHDQSWTHRAVKSYQSGDLSQDGDGTGENV